MWEALTQLAPQKMFIIQGDETTFGTLLAEIQAQVPFAHALSVSRFTMTHAQDVARFAIEGTGSERVLIVHFTVFSSDAAQVLLKSLEEPDKDTTIVFVTPHPYVVPQTVRSRVMIVATDITRKARTTSALLTAMQKEADSKDDDAAARRARALVLLDELELALRDDASRAKILYEAKEMLYRANLPTKFVLEYVGTMLQ